MKTDVKQRFPYVLEIHEGMDDELRPVWWLRPLSNRRRASILDMAVVHMPDGTVRHQDNTVSYIAATETLVGGENLIDKHGNRIEFEARADGRPTDAFMDQLELDWIRELGAAAYNESYLSEDEKKDSE